MTMQAADTTVRQSVVIDAPIERAFETFTVGMGTWWPVEHHIIEAEFAEMVFERRVGGHVYDRGVDGSECHWSRVLAYDPPDRLVISWDIGPDWKLEPDPDRTSEIEVRFTAEADHRTRVDLEHRNLEPHGDGWEQLREAIGRTRAGRAGSGSPGTPLSAAARTATARRSRTAPAGRAARRRRGPPRRRRRPSTRRRRSTPPPAGGTDGSSGRC